MYCTVLRRCRILQPQKRAVPVGDGAGYVLLYSTARRAAVSTVLLIVVGYWRTAQVEMVEVVGDGLRYETRLADWGWTGQDRTGACHAEACWGRQSRGVHRA